MSESDERLEEPTVEVPEPPILMTRVLRERWGIPGSLRRPMVERLGAIIRDPGAPHGEVLSAATAILAASKINLANIAMTMKVKEIEDLEKRVEELECKLGMGKAD